MQDSAAATQSVEKITQDQLDAMVGLHTRFLEGRVGGRRATLKNIDLSQLSLRGQDLRQASFIGCVMIGMDLADAVFQESSLYACNLSNSNLHRTNFIRADLRGARIENANLEGADLEKADLRVGGLAEDGSQYDSGQAVNFRGANLSGAKLAGSMATRADFSDAILAGANIANADFRGAQLEGADLSDAEVDGAKFNGANLKSAIMTGIEMKNFNTKDVDMAGAITDENIGTSIAALEQPLPKLIEDHRAWVESAGKNGKQLDLSGVDMRQLKTLKQEKMTAIKAEGTKFFGMNLYKIELQSAVLDGSDFRNCDLVEADLRGSSFKNVNLSHSKLQGVNGSPLMFGSSGQTRRFSPCDFTGAKFRYSDLSGAQLRSAVFIGADLSYTNLSNADLRDADFTGASIVGMNLEGALTEGAKFDRGGKLFRIPTEN